MKQKLKLNLLAASLALAFAAPSYAVGPGTTPDHILYVGGGAEQNNVFETIATSLFQPGSIDYYTDEPTGTAKGRSFRAVYGKLAAAAGNVPAGANVLVIYRSLGGVFANGINPLVRGQLLPYYQVIGNATAIAGSTNPSYRITNTSLTTPNAPDIGLANEELTLFTQINLPTGIPAVTPAELAKVNSRALYAVVNGIAATNNLAAAIAAARPDGEGLRKAEIAAILAGNFENWSDIDPAFPNAPVILIDRNFGSGAKAAANQYFQNNPGGSGYSGTAEPANLSGDFGDPVNYSQQTVRTEPSAGNVPGVLDGVAAKGAYGIGLLGLENIPGPSSQWRFIPIGYASAGSTSFDKTDAISGKYDYFYQASVNTRNSVVNGQRYHQAGTTWGNLINAFISKAVSPAVITTVPGTILDPITFPPSGNPALDAFRARGTRFGNSTAPLTLVE
ncbi:hypothetical protein [Nitrosovibrio sp. Nv17]|jgi:hypothetical protein|uniref:hypothetical protein n=1 Tax=Nitrosovibrio sp. Nv17 TaxID=1855339 RepID=UPI000908F907|nr:hypothetical protein [Nitrosovibrio sp. Nv17]SFW10910.1 hypothetical protein SAMN05216414_101154 [Nitrosovibrio sp. Nv17]